MTTEITIISKAIIIQDMIRKDYIEIGDKIEVMIEGKKEDKRGDKKEKEMILRRRRVIIKEIETIIKISMKVEEKDLKVKMEKKMITINDSNYKF
jgi:hypothetical protein